MTDARRDGMTRARYEVHVYSHRDAERVVMHYHSGFFEIYCLLKGSVLYQLDRQQHQLAPGHLLVIPPDVLHWPIHIDEDKPYVRMFLWIEQRYLETLSTRQTDLSAGLRPPYAPVVLPLSAAETLELKELLSGLSALGDCHGYGEDVESEALLKLFLLRVNRINQSDCASRLPAEHPGELITETLAYIDSHIHETLKISQIAEALSISRSGLEKQFSCKTGVSIYQYIVKRRMLLAGKLMKNGCPAAEAARQTGYQDYVSFYRAFKKEFGMSPAQFRRI